MRVIASPVALVAVLLLCGPAWAQPAPSGAGPNPALPKPDPSAAATRFSRVTGWPEGRTPAAPAGFRAAAFARGLDSPRWLHVLPNGDVLVAEARSLPRSTDDADKHRGMVAGGSVGVSPNRIVLLRDADRDGVAEARHVLLDNLNQPFGMALLGEHLYVANTDGLMRFPFTPGQTSIDAPGQLVLALPAGGYNNHWTRNVITSPDGAASFTSRSARRATSARTACRRRCGARTCCRSIPTAPGRRCSRQACATRSASGGSPSPARCGRR